MCSSGTLLDANNYLYSSLISQNLNVFQKTPQVLQTPNLNNLAQTYTEYYKCDYTAFIDNTNANIALQASATSASDSCSSCRSSSLIFDKMASTACSQINETIFPQDILETPTVSSDYAFSDLSKCQKLAISTPPSTAAYDSTNSKCTNIVTQVKYVIFWKDQTIQRILTRVIISDVPFSYSKVKQSFELKWQPYNDTQLGLITSVSDFESYLTSTQTLESIKSGSTGKIF